MYSMVQNLETVLPGGLGQMSLVNDWIKTSGNHWQVTSVPISQLVQLPDSEGTHYPLQLMPSIPFCGQHWYSFFPISNLPSYQLCLLRPHSHMHTYLLQLEQPSIRWNRILSYGFSCPACLGHWVSVEQIIRIFTLSFSLAKVRLIDWSKHFASQWTINTFLG